MIDFIRNFICTNDWLFYYLIAWIDNVSILKFHISKRLVAIGRIQLQETENEEIVLFNENLITFLSEDNI